MEYMAKTQAAYNAIYRQQLDSWSQESELRQAAPYLLNRLKLDYNKQEINILDIGCGHGNDGLYFNQQHINYHGIDTYNSQICYQRSQQHKNFKFTHQSVFRFQSAIKFKGILDNGCFHHFHQSDQNRYFERIENLLDDNGLLLITCFHNGENTESKDQNGRLMRNYTIDKISNLCAENNFIRVGHKLVQRTNYHNQYLFTIFKRDKLS